MRLNPFLLNEASLLFYLIVVEIKLSSGENKLSANSTGYDMRLSESNSYDRPMLSTSEQNPAFATTFRRNKKITFMLPKVSYEGVAKVGLIQANLLNAWRQYDVEIISLLKEQTQFKELLKNLRVRYSFPMGAASRAFYNFFAFSTRITANIIIAHNLPASAIANNFMKKSGIPYIPYIHDASFRKIPGSIPLYSHRSLKKALSESKIVFTNSQRTLKTLKSEYGISGITLYPGCFVEEKHENKRCNYFLFVHFISPRASYTFLSQLLEKEDFNLIIAGGRRWGWRKVVNSYKKFGNRVQFVFEPSESELLKLYQQAKGLIFPEVENFGLPPLEAAACGCPSVSAKGSGVTEILKDCEEIITCKEGNIDEFREAIHLLREDEYAMALGKRAWLAAKRYSWNAHISKLVEAIETAGVH